MSDISLNASTRTNLLALQKNTASIDRTSLRLSTGKRVNAATDNVRAFILAKALTDRGRSQRGSGQPVGPERRPLPFHQQPEHNKQEPAVRPATVLEIF